MKCSLGGEIRFICNILHLNSAQNPDPTEVLEVPKSYTSYIRSAVWQLSDFQWGIKGSSSACSTREGHGCRTIPRLAGCSVGISQWDLRKIKKFNHMCLHPSLDQRSLLPLSPPSPSSDFFKCSRVEQSPEVDFTLTTTVRPSQCVLFSFNSPRFLPHTELA